MREGFDRNSVAVSQAYYNDMLRRIGVIYEDVFDKITDVERELTSGLGSELCEMVESVAAHGHAIEELSAVLEKAGILIQYPEADGGVSTKAPEVTLCPAADRLRSSRRCVENLTRRVQSLSRQVNL